MTKNILKAADLKNIPSINTPEPLVDLAIVCPEIDSHCHRVEYPPHLQKILLREGVAQRLARAQKVLSESFPNQKLRIVEGYRHPDYQESLFETEKARLTQMHPNVSEKELIELVHLCIAYPPVAGHPTGGAIDVTIIENEISLDMGTEIADFSDPEKMSTFARNITPRQRENRMHLHDLLTAEEFAPFYGEWWHFSYGDVEWAVFYKKKAALYSPIRLGKDL